MSKKKVQYKGKSKHTADYTGERAFRQNDNENSEEEYTTVVDLETNKKYGKRIIQNNWSKYEASLSDYESEDEAYQIPKTEDFNHLLKTASSDCSHFQLNSEKLWKIDKSLIPPSKIFNLDLNMLFSGLACIPFYERMELNENDLSVEDKQRFDAAAEKSRKDYTLLREKSLKKVEDESKVKNCKNLLSSLEEALRDELNLVLNSEKNEKTEGEPETAEFEKMDENMKKVEMCENKSSERGENKSKIFFSENEDLEGWLDIVLDD